MGFQTQPFTISDFSGGITDHYINGKSNCYQQADNLLILPNKTLINRYGSVIDDTDNPQIPSGAERISTLINYNNSEKMFVQSAKKIWFRDPSAYTELVGPVDSNPVFNAGTTASYVSHTQWNRHLFVTNDAFAYVSKIYKDSGGTYRVRTAGLPSLTAPTVAQAAFTKTGDTTSGSPTIANLSSVTGLEVGQGISGTGIPASTTILGISGTTLTISNNATATNVGTTLTFTGVRSYVYTFHYYFTYTIGTQVFEDFGPTTTVQAENFIEPGAHVTTNITVIPAIANGANTNYDTANIKVYIYRTQADETVGYYVKEITNGTTSTTDTASDSSIESGLILYTTGGVLDNDPPPLCKYIHVTNNICYYAHTKDGSQVLPNTYQASVPFDPDSCPASFVDEVEDEITGFSSVQSIPIILCKKHIYRVEGAFDELGRGFMSHTRISDTAGCISNQSVVQAESGLFWCGNDGIYYSDGYRAFKITNHLNETYALMVDALEDTENIVGAFDEKNRRIYWGSQIDASSGDNDFCFVLDLRWGISEESVFTTISGGDTESFSPTSLLYFDGLLYRADKRGYVFEHDEETKTDPKVDSSVAASTWDTQTVIYNFKGIVSNFGITHVRKWVPRMFLSAKNKTNISIQINVLNDDRTSVRELREIRWRGNFVWDNAEFIWGEDCEWIAEGVIEQWRHLPVGGLRVSYLQVQITNAYTIITTSDILGDATFDTTAKTATIDDAVQVDWPEEAVDYYISQEGDTYVKEYQISERAADVLTYVDNANTSSSGSQGWQIKGYRKGEILNLLSYTLMFAAISRSAVTHEAGDSGENA